MNPRPPFVMHLIRLSAAWLVLLSAAWGQEVELVRVWTGHRAAESFTRISEYFTGEENTGGQTVLRTDPAQRTGYYWLIRTSTSARMAEVRVEISVVETSSLSPSVSEWLVDLPEGNHVTLAGLTGTAWQQPGTQPVAWRLRLLSPDGRELAREQSFLWTGPE